MLEKNSLATYQSRNENVIRHPPEAYAEVSIRSIHKIRNAAAGTSTKETRGKEITLAIWTACLGAILGYIPEMNAIYKAKSLNNSAFIYLVILIIGIVFFFIWREKCQKESMSTIYLSNLIQEEFSEERIPINQNQGNFENLNATILNRNVGNSEYAYVAFSSNRKEDQDAIS